MPVMVVTAHVDTAVPWAVLLLVLLPFFFNSCCIERTVQWSAIIASFFFPFFPFFHQLMQVLFEREFSIEVISSSLRVRIVSALC